MFLDAREVDEGTEIECDVCVVGAGAAGITIARALAATDLRVCVLESGGLEPDRRTQALYEGEIAGRPYDLLRSRLRFFGGSTNHWQGWCRPLDEVDFDEREGLPHGTWPITRRELEPYYRGAHEICELGPYSYDPAFWARATRTTTFDLGRDVADVVFQFSKPTRFGQRYRRDLERARRVRVLVNANLGKLELTPSGGRVERAQVATLGGRRFAVRANRYVLAAGAIENARLLLASNDVRTRGIGNENDLVGRYFCDHLQSPLGAFTLSEPRAGRPFYGVHQVRGQSIVAGLATSDRVVRAEGLVRFSAFFQEFPVEGGLGRAVGAVMRDLEGGRASGPRVLHMVVEPAPDPDSRITLSRERDALGLPKVRLDWRVGDAERRSVAHGAELIATALGAHGLGRLQSKAGIEKRFWENVRGASHHFGTTRMQDDPRRGVVDSDCRVHGIPNLFVAGSAVFPRAGISNPTLTIVALALRMADHLRKGAA